MEMNYPKIYNGQILEVNVDVAARNQDGLMDWSKTQCKWVVETGWWVPRVEVGGDVSLGRAKGHRGPESR